MSQIIYLTRGETALFGYGSLCSVASLERSLGRHYEGPFVRCEVEGWRRSWDVGMPNRAFFLETPEGRVYPEHILYLNVKPAPGCLLNGVLFVVNDAELELRRQKWSPPAPKVSSGYLALYARLVGSADRGAIIER